MVPMLDLASKDLNYTPFQLSKASAIFLGLIGFLATFVNVGNIFYILKYKRFSNAINYIVMFDSMLNLIGFLVMAIFSVLAMNSPKNFGNLGCTFYLLNILLQGKSTRVVDLDCNNLVSFG